MDEMCAYGDGNHPAERVQSGTPICWQHWYWVKLNLPAATHWKRVGEEFLSNVDMWDLMSYLPACGLTQEEMTIMLKGAEKVVEFSKRVVEGTETGPRGSA